MVARCGDRSRVIPASDLYRTADRRRSAFRGEAALTAAILDVSSPDKKKIYFVRGHGETSLEDVSPGGLSNLRDELRVRNYELAPLELNVTRRVPDDAALVIIAGALWSAWRLTRGRQSTRGPAVTARRLAAGNVVIALGTLILSASGTLAGRLGKDTAFAVTLVAGVVVLFCGFLIATPGRPARAPSWLTPAAP